MSFESHENVSDEEIYTAETGLRLPLSERLAINATANLPGTRILCTTSGRGQCAIELVKRQPDRFVVCHFLEAFAATETAELATQLEAAVNIECSADFPEQEFDLCVLPMSRSGESELSREQMQDAYDLLKTGGMLVVTIDQPKDKWFHHEVEKLGKNLTRLQKRKGVVYLLKKVKPLKKRKDFSCEIGFRDGEQIIKAISRPGVFSHRRLDLGARALIESMQVTEGDHVLDLGCGSGVVGLAAGKRCPGVEIHFVDSNARAVECAMQGAQLNGLERVSGTLSHDGSIGSEEEDLSGTFDVVLGNPPYYSHFQIAEIFLQSGLRALKTGGTIQIVTKQTEWLVARMEQLFDQVTLSEVRGYGVVRGIKR